MNDKLFQDFEAVSAKQWKQKIQVDLKGADYNDSLIYKSNDGIDVKPFYHQDSIKKSNMPNSPKQWDICEKIYVASEKTSIKNTTDLLARGAESIWLIIPSEKIQVQNILNHIDLENIPVFIEFKFLSEAYLLDLCAYLKNKKNKVSLGLDSIGKLAKSGNWHKNLNADLEILSKIISVKTLDSTLSIDLSLYQNAGANIPQQIAYALAHANEYLNHFSAKNEIGTLTFKVAIGSNYFFEIAKLKALRTVFSAVASAYGSNQEIKILAFPTKRNKTLYDYNINMLRTTTESMSAILGGADTICNAAYDGIFHKKNEFGNRIARNQLLILKEESYLGKTTHAADGSYYLETLTTQFAEKALTLFKDIEKGGGFLKLLKEGTIQRKIKESAEKDQVDFDKNERILVGTNKYKHPDDRMKNELELYPFLKQNPRKTLVEPILERRLAEKSEQKRLEEENR